MQRDGCEDRGVKRTFTGMAGLMALLLICAAGCHRTPAPKPLAELTPTEQAGHAVYAQHCSLCHYERQDRALNGPALVSLYKKPYLPSGAPANDDRVTYTILHGRGNMPAQGNALNDGDLADLLAYLHTL